MLELWEETNCYTIIVQPNTERIVQEDRMWKRENEYSVFISSEERITMCNSCYIKKDHSSVYIQG